MRALCLAALVLALAPGTRAASTIEPDHAAAWSANAGWTDWRADADQGVAIGEYVCEGFVYSANVGWLSLGNGYPKNGRYYENNSPTDFGVNVDADGTLRGYGYGANIGWVAFEARGNPRVSLQTGIFAGYAYAANAGWLSLSNAVAFLQTGSVAAGKDSDGDGIPDAWELSYADDLTTFGANHDADDDGFDDAEEYLADTNPLNSRDNLRVTAVVPAAEGAEVTITWTSKSTRRYQVQKRALLDSQNPWTDVGVTLEVPDPGPATTRTLDDVPAPLRFYRIKALRPLTP